MSRLSFFSLFLLGAVFLLPFDVSAAVGDTCYGNSTGKQGTCQLSINCSPADVDISGDCPGIICCANSATGGGQGGGPTGGGASTGGGACVLTTGEAGTCGSSTSCTTGWSSVAACTGGQVCCRTVAGGGSSGGTTGSTTGGAQPGGGGGSSTGTGSVACTNSDGATGNCLSSSACTSGGGLVISFSACGNASLVCCQKSAFGGTGTGSGTGVGGGSSAGGGASAVVCNGVIKSGVCFPVTTGLSSQPVATLLLNLMDWLLAILGFIAIIAFIISGLQYLLSTGDEGMAETAKRNMQYSIIGVLVALSGWVIIQAIDGALSGWFFF